MLCSRLIDVTDAGQVWSCGIQVADVEAQGPAGHELRKRLLARLRREGIALGVPARVLREMPPAVDTADKDQRSLPSVTPGPKQ